MQRCECQVGSGWPLYENAVRGQVHKTWLMAPRISEESRHDDTA